MEDGAFVRHNHRRNLFYGKNGFNYGFALGVIVVLLIIAGVALLVVKACDESAKAKGEAYYKEYNRQVNENLKKQEFGKGYGIKCPKCGYMW